MSRFACILLFTILAAARTGFPHEIRPAYLQIEERADDSVIVRWKQPVLGDSALAITPVLSSGWLDTPPGGRRKTRDALVKEWIVTPPRATLAGQTIEITGLERTITDVLVSISYRDGGGSSHIIRADEPRLVIGSQAGRGGALNGYFILGVEHIWTGLDHLAYVFCLILLITRPWTLVKTITAFTLAHSVTLACAVLDLVRLDARAVEAVIALSIVYVAVELVNTGHGHGGLAARKPWIIAFAFGLLHGFGFAGALQSIGLPRSNIPGALLLFNLGIEAGQVLFIAVVLVLLRMAARLPRLRTGLFRLAPYGAGSVASFWLIERVARII